MRNRTRPSRRWRWQNSDLGLAVLVLHHPKKGETKEGQAARGIGVLNAEVDIVLEMTHFSNPSSDDRRRKIVAYSRFDETPRRRLLELNREGTDYTAADGARSTWHGIRMQSVRGASLVDS